jgi:hypothetical protein
MRKYSIALANALMTLGVVLMVLSIVAVNPPYAFADDGCLCDIVSGTCTDPCTGACVTDSDCAAPNCLADDGCNTGGCAYQQDSNQKCPDGGCSPRLNANCSQCTCKGCTNALQTFVCDCHCADKIGVCTLWNPNDPNSQQSCPEHIP